MDLNHPFLIEKHKEFMEQFEKHNLQYVVYGGVMLGLERDNNLIEWDKDIDYGFLERDYNKVEKIIQDLGYRKTTKDNKGSNLYVDASPNRIGKMMQLYLEHKLYVDFKFFKENENQKLIFNGQHLPLYPLKYIIESNIEEYHGVEFRLSNHKLEWIKYDYGTNWDTPIKETYHNEWLNRAEGTWKLINKK